MQISHTGSEVFDTFTSNAKPEPDGSAPETNLFKILDTAIAALNTPVEGDQTKADAFTAAMDKTNRGLSNSLNNVLTVRADLGIKLDELGKLDSLGDDRALGQTQQMSDLVDVDWNSVISSYSMQQAALQASYKAFSDMQGMSLFQMNK
jgi:flagellar hook-associated protein 3 FlgL